MTTDTSPLAGIPPLQYDTNPRPKKRRRRDLVSEPPKDSNAAEVLPDEVVADLLNRCSIRILQSVGFSGATAGSLERMRQLAEDCMAPA
jgi:hypothetical protein